VNCIETTTPVKGTNNEKRAKPIPPNTPSRAVIPDPRCRLGRATTRPQQRTGPTRHQPTQRSPSPKTPVNDVSSSCPGAANRDASPPHCCAYRQQQVDEHPDAADGRRRLFACRSVRPDGVRLQREVQFTPTPLVFIDWKDCPNPTGLPNGGLISSLTITTPNVGLLPRRRRGHRPAGLVVRRGSDRRTTTRLKPRRRNGR